jgi:dienelactone hydrolase
LWKAELGLKGELVRVWTEDDLQLQGLYCPPQASSVLPAVLHIHGASSNFYRSPFLDDLADRLTDQGFAFLTGNTRGHDIMNNVYSKDPTAGRHMGMAFEVFEECLFDLDAWLTFLEERGHGGAALVGHSFGAHKAAFYQSETADARIRALVLLSPADQGFWLDAMGDDLQATLTWASEAVAAGEGDTLFSGGLAPYPMSARTIHNLFVVGKPDIFKFGRPDEPWEVVSRIACPVLVTMGTVAEFAAPGTEMALGTLKAKALAAARCDTVIVRGAPHNYRGYEARVTQIILRWLIDLFAS